MRRLIPVVLCAHILAACVSSPRIVKLGMPGEPIDESPYAGETVYLKAFTVKNKSPKDSQQAEAYLKEQFIEYVRKHGKFSNVVDATSKGTRPPAEALTMNVDLQLQNQDQTIGFMGAYYGLFVLWSIAPRKGNVTVIGNAVLQKGGRTISSKSWTSGLDYAYTFYGSMRTGPIQRVFKACFEDVFAHISIPDAPAGGPGVSKAELESLVKASVDKATKKEEKVYNSDVDKPAYKGVENPNNFALVVGIEKYQQIAQADFGERDAQTVRDHLAALGYPLRNIVHLSGNMATKSNLEKYLEHWLPERVNENSRLVFYFSGHGAPDLESKQAFLVPWDADVKFLKETGYPLKRLYSNLNALKAKEVLVALDSCFSGAGGRSVLPKGARPLVTKVDDGLDAAGKLVILSASEGDEISLSDETQGHGLFTYHLLKGLNERGGVATVKGLYDYLVPRVQDGARAQNRDQTPKLIASEESLSAMNLGE